MRHTTHVNIFTFLGVEFKQWLQRLFDVRNVIEILRNKELQSFLVFSKLIL